MVIEIDKIEKVITGSPWDIARELERINQKVIR